MMLSFLYLVFLHNYALTCRHDQLAWVVEPEIGLHDLSFALGNEVSSVSFDCFAQIPYDSVLAETTDDEALDAFLALVELGRQEAEILNGKSLQIEEGNFKFYGSRPVIEVDFLVKE